MRTMLLSITLAAGLAQSALAQQSFFNPSAAQPSTGTLLYRQTFEYADYGHDPTGLDRDVQEITLNTQLAYGLTRDLTAMALIPVKYRDVQSPQPGVSDEAFGLADIHLMLKYRFWQRDTGPIDTMRAGLMIGVDVPTGQAPFGNTGVDPMIGAVFTSIQGRHGLNAAVRYKFNTDSRDDLPITIDDGSDDALYLDAGYLFRLSPAEYTDDTHGAWYAMADLNTTYKANGDWQVRIAPGIMYEARTWVFEASVQLPVYQDLSDRPELEFAVGIGFRVFF